MPLTKVSNSMIVGASVNVLDYGAVTGGGSATANNAAFTSAITSLMAQGGGSLYIPTGTYDISATITILYTAITQGVVIYGQGKTSVLNWVGGNNDSMLQLKGNAGGATIAAYSLTVISNLAFENGNASTGLIGIEIGDTSGAAAGVGNSNISSCYIHNCNTGIRNWNESNEMTVEDCHIFEYTGYGIRINSRGIRILNNHIQAGAASSIGVFSDSSSIVISGNVIESAEAINAIELSNVRAFEISGNYSEGSGAVTNKCINIIACDGGVIKNNTFGGYAGTTLITVGVLSRDVEIGANSHAVSGGALTAFIEFGGSPVGCTVTGEQNIAGTSATIVGTPVTRVRADRLFVQNINTEYGSVTAAASATTDLFTIPATNTCYMVYIDNAADKYGAVGMVYVPETSTTAELASIKNTNANMILAVSGVKVQVTLGAVGSSRTISYRALRIS